MILWNDLPGAVMWTMQSNGHTYGPVRYTRAAVITEITDLYTGGWYAGKTRKQKWRKLRSKDVRVVRVKLVVDESGVK